MLCRDNWVDISWDGLQRRKQKENLRVIFNQKADRIVPFDLACDQTAQEIYSQYKNLYVTLSGGCDSENVANVFLRNKIPFTPLILVYDNADHRNQLAENWYAFEWCKRNNIEPKVVYSKNFVGSTDDKAAFLDLRPRLYNGTITSTLLLKHINDLGGNMVNGYQLEYYPDHEQMTYLEPQLGNYQGFVMQETDYYLETQSPNQHPWAFYYWSPDIMAAFVSVWDTSATMQQNKATIYKVEHRPKINYPQLVTGTSLGNRFKLLAKFGTVDCALLGTKQSLLEKLVK